MVYPGSTPEFRILQRQDGTQVLQIRYIKTDVEYASLWADVPIVKE